MEASLDSYFDSGSNNISQEALLFEHALSLETESEGRIAIHLRISALSSHFRQAYHIRIASRTFDPLLLRYDVRLYVLKSGDIVLVGHNMLKRDVEAVLARIYRLFRGDPLLTVKGNPLVRSYNLEAEFEGFFRAVTKMIERSHSLPPPREWGTPISPKTLDKICIEIDHLDFSGLIEEQTAIRFGANNQHTMLFAEQFVSIAALRQRLGLEVDLLVDRWLFQHLTSHLDRRMLESLGRRNFAQMSGAISVNLNVSTIFGAQFKAFERNVGGNTRRVVLEFQQADVLSDLGNYFTAREYLMAAGYRVLIDGLSPLSLQFFHPELLVADYYKVYWGQGSRDRMDAVTWRQAKELTQKMGAEKVVMCRVDSEQAIRFGLELGIRHYQGRFVDRLRKNVTVKGEPAIPKTADGAAKTPTAAVPATA